jgi:D-inositol-3-phosphate glycosyltransferase
VEIVLDGRSLGKARLGLPRPDVAGAIRAPEAPIAGFEYVISPRDLSGVTGQATVEALAHHFDGTTSVLSSATIRVAAGRDRPDPQPDGADLPQGARLRHRPSVGRLPTYPSHLLVFTHSMGYSGAELYLFEVVRRLVRHHDFQCTVVTLRDGPLRPVLELDGIPVHVSPCPTFSSPAAYEGRMGELLAWADRLDFQAVVANTLEGYIGVDLASRLGRPSLWAIHESWDPAMWLWLAECAPQHPYVSERLHDALAASTLIFEAEATRQLYLPYGSPARLRTLPYAIELGEIDDYPRERGAQARRALGISGARTVVLTLGTIEPRKAQTALAMAFAQIADDHPDAVLVMVGETDEEWTRSYVDALRHYIRRTGLERRILIVSKTPDPYAWLAAADLLALASDVESLPRVLLEAMAFQVPVVATSVFGVPRLVREGSTGYLCEPRDIRALANALDRALCAPPTLRQAIGATGRRQVQDEHDPDDYAARVAALLRTAIGDDQVSSNGSKWTSTAA